VAIRSPQRTPAVWRRADLRPDEWTVELGATQRSALVAAGRRLAADGIPIDRIDRSTFALDDLASDLAAWSAMLEQGRGFVLLRGFPIDELSDLEIEAAYMALGAHLGRPVGQNKHGDLLTHVRDERLVDDGTTVRLYRTRARQDFHTDGADIIGLLCLHGALAGGESKLVSSGALFNEILHARPDLLEQLYRPMCWDRQGEHAPGEQPWFELAPLNDVDGVPRLFYLGWYIRAAQQHAGVPRLTDAQAEAMELLEQLANDPEFHLEMTFEPGDVQLINNGRILHAREAYEDADELSERRHLLRLWLAAHRFTSLEEPLRAGLGRND
jgi:hypothetical protein